jgi:hypothetical protein
MAEIPTKHLQGMYRDILYDATGRVQWTRDTRPNTIVVDCRRLLAGFMLGQANTFGIQGLQLGAGLAAWDAPGGAPAAGETQSALADPNPWTVPASELDVTYLDGETPTTTPTNRVQIVAEIGPGVPDWPDADHPTLTLREFGLVGRLNDTPVLINYVIHSAIVKDPVSTLERTIWLIF